MNQDDPVEGPRTTKGTFKKGRSGNPTGLRKDGTAPNTPRHDTGDDLSHSDRQLLEKFDGWGSVFTGIGDPTRDKRMSHEFEPACLTYQEALNLWRGDDLAARAVEKVPEQCFRQGYDIEMSDDGSHEELNRDLMDLLQEIGLDDNTERGMKVERAVGGAAMMLGVDDGGRSIATPLDPARVRKIEWLKVLEPIELYPDSFYDDPTKPKFGEPELYRLTGITPGNGSVVPTKTAKSRHVIHESRLVVFPGIKVSNYQQTNNMVSQHWGDSILIRLVEVLRDFNVAWHGAGILATDFSQSVISIENLMALVAKEPAKLIARMRAMEYGRSIARAVMIDAKEKYERHTTSLTGLPDLLEKLSRRLAAALDMPLSILMGAGESGIGKDGLSDVRHYYDGIAAIQRRRVEPILRRVIKLCMGTLRKRGAPKTWNVKFRPLWQLTEGEIAESRLNMARADSLYLKGGVLTPDELRKSRFQGGYSIETQVQVGKKAPGFLAPLPAGVVPGTSVGVTPGAMAEANAKKTGANAHSVQSYARRNPTSSPAGAGAKGGGDVEGGTRADEDGPATVRPFAGLPIAIENERGTIRKWPGGETKMRYAYGYIEGVVGADGDSVDVYLGPNHHPEWVYVVHQMKAPDFMEYDEDKVMLGFDSPNHACDAYRSQYDADGFYGGMSIMSLDDFVRRLRYADGSRITNADVDDAMGG